MLWTKRLFVKATPLPIQRIHNEATWDQDEIQFARIVAEMSMIGIRKGDKKALAKRLGISENSLGSLIDRAERKWQEVVANTDPNEGYSGGYSHHVGGLYESALYEPAPPQEALEDPALHQCELILDETSGIAELLIARKPRPGSATPRGLSIQARVFDGKATCMVTTAEGVNITLQYQPEGISIGTNNHIHDNQLDAQGYCLLTPAQRLLPPDNDAALHDIDMATAQP